MSSKILQPSMPPIVMVQVMEKLVSTLQKYITELTKGTNSSHQLTPSPTRVVAYATSTAPRQPLSEHNTKILTDLFPSICGLEGGTRTENGRTAIREYFDAVTEQELMDFWKDEWIV